MATNDNTNDDARPPTTPDGGADPADDTDETPPLAAALATKTVLERIDRSKADEEAASMLMKALEALDYKVLNADPVDLASVDPEEVAAVIDALTGDVPTADIDGVPLPAAADEAAEGIAAPFHTLPTVEDPTDDEREEALHWYGPDAVPEEGPVPEPGYRVLQSTTLEVPDWVVEAVRWRLSHDDPEAETIDRQKIEVTLHDYVTSSPAFVDRHGEDVVAQLRAEFGSDERDLPTMDAALDELLNQRGE